ncbi:hypothetical protein MnTg02_01018 [bacterium MnTg02]|nr:hypothetical protein MnTg02_01018 [bacterium MnTg02]
MSAHISTAPFGAAGGPRAGQKEGARPSVVSVMVRVGRFFQDLKRASDAAAQYEYLSGLTDHELRNRDLDRTMIAHSVYEKHFGGTS